MSLPQKREREVGEVDVVDVLFETKRAKTRNTEQNLFQPVGFSSFNLIDYLGLFHDFSGSDKIQKLINAIKQSVQAQLCRWQYLDFNALLQLFCDDILGLQSEQERCDVLAAYFHSPTSSPDLVGALEFFLTLNGFRGFNADVKAKFSTIVTFITTAQSGLSTFSPTSLVSASTPLTRSVLSLSYILPELVSASKALWEYDPGDQLTNCISESPELKSMLEREDRRRAIEREMEETSTAPFPPLSVVVNFVHGCIKVNEGVVNTVDTFTVPPGMNVWVVMQATPACLNYNNSQLPSRLRKVYERVEGTKKNHPLFVAAAMQKELVKARKEVVLEKPNEQRDFSYRVNYRQLMLEPRVVCLREGDTYINKYLSFSNTEPLYKSIVMLNKMMDMTPPVLARAVKFRFVDVVNGARMRGARNLLIMDISCAAVCRTSSLSWLRSLFPARTCLSLMQAGLAGGSKPKSRRRKSRSSRKRRSPNRKSRNRKSRKSRDRRSH